MKKTIKFIAARLRETSTLNGIATLAMLAGLPDGAVSAGVQVLAALGAVAAVVMPEGAAKGE